MYLSFLLKDWILYGFEDDVIDQKINLNSYLYAFMADNSIIPLVNVDKPQENQTSPLQDITSVDLVSQPTSDSQFTSASWTFPESTFTSIPTESSMPTASITNQAEFKSIHVNTDNQSHSNVSVILILTFCFLFFLILNIILLICIRRKANKSKRIG